MQRYLITSSVKKSNLGLKVGFLKSLLEDTLGITYSPDTILTVFLHIEKKGCSGSGFVEIYATISTKRKYLSAWTRVSSLLGGAVRYDELVFTYKGKKLINNEPAYYFSLRKVSGGWCDDGEVDGADDETVSLPSTEPDDSMDDLLRDNEQYNKKWDGQAISPSPVLATNTEEEKIKNFGPSPSFPAPGGNLRSTETPSKPHSTHPSPASVLPKKRDVEGGHEDVPLKKRKMLLLESKNNKEPDPRTLELKPPLVLETCANEINALESQIRTVAASSASSAAAAASSAAAAAKIAAGFANEKATHRYSRAVHFVETGTAMRSTVFKDGDAGVFYNHVDHRFSSYTFKESSRWGETFIASIKTPLIVALKAHGAIISPSLETVLRGRWPYNLWMGDLNNTALLPAGVGVVALEDIPAGSFVAQFIGEYISWDDLPKPTPEIFIAYCEQAKLASNKTEHVEVKEEPVVLTGDIDSKESGECSDDEIYHNEIDTLVSKPEATKHLWLGNISRKCTDSALEQIFDGEVSVRLFATNKVKRPYAYVNFPTVSGAVNAMDKLQGSIIFSVTGGKPLLIRFTQAENEGDGGGGGGDKDDGTAGGGDDCSRYYEDFYYRNLQSEAGKRYRVHIAEGTECVVPVENGSCPKQLKLIERGRVPHQSKNAALCND